MQEMKGRLSVMLLGLVLASSGYAQESRVEKQALRCSAFFIVLSASADALNFAQNFADAYSKERSDQGAAVTGAEIQQRREQVLQELKQTYLSDQAGVLEEAVLCGAWAEGYRLQGDNPAYVPILPKIIPQQVRAFYAEWASVAFKKWLALK
jgi:hypothetical protein